ncbi:MAG TPA: virion core protein (lumpy skin disease virus), partial [Coriobacteriia bacterium]|nr:virion core protein (lumpy skin disease virus) [Coriobacteriia bacterium]
MGFIEAFTGALGGSFADQWKDFYTVPATVSATAGICPAVQHRTDAGRGSNTKGSENIITNGSKIVIPEGFALVTFENGAITGFVAQAGGYIYTNDTSVHSQSFFTGGGLVESVIRNSWERFKYGGIPGDQQLAFYVNLKEIPNNKFGTQSPIYWDDSYLQAQVGAITRGSYTLKISDPILFVKGYVPAQYIVQNAAPFDFADFGNQAAEQLFNEVVQSLSAAFSKYTNDPDRNHRITGIQSDSVGFAQSLSAAVEENYQWSSARGLAIIKTALASVEYDETTKALLADVQKADALSGSRGNAFLQQ